MNIPYGIRASHEATVSMPLSWKNLKEVTSPERFNIKSVPDWIKKRKDPWENMHLAAVNLHQVQAQH